MEKSKKNFRFIKKIKKPAELILVPLAFTLALLGLAVLLLVTSAGDIFSYANVLLMKKNGNSYRVENFFAPSEQDKGTIPLSDIQFPTYGSVYGEIIIESAEIDCPLIYGDDKAILKRGAGQYIGSTIIGYGRTTMVCAHINRHFANLHLVKPGDRIRVVTSYGTYQYEVTYTGIHDAADKSVYDFTRQDENLVLYTCYYQQTAFGNVKKRFFVCADYVSGPMLVKGGTNA